jgi:hypothetical protein
MEVSSKKLKRGLGMKPPKDRVRLDNELTTIPPETVENRLFYRGPHYPHTHTVHTCASTRAMHSCASLLDCLSSLLTALTRS